MSVSKPLWIRGSWEPPNVSSHSLLRENPVDPRFFGGAATNHTRVGFGKCQVVPRIILGQEVEGNEGGIGFPAGNRMKPQQLCKDDSFVQKTAQQLSAFKEKVDNRKKLHEFLGLKKFGRSSLPAF